jgi:hypothetical protein
MLSQLVQMLAATQPAEPGEAHPTKLALPQSERVRNGANTHLSLTLAPQKWARTLRYGQGRSPPISLHRAEPPWRVPTPAQVRRSFALVRSSGLFCSSPPLALVEYLVL